ncbi:hypothetical protein Cgig2_031941 [Carnegiea gigantea]|uniref:SNRNP25 ubiquitin-like domain-containing protein n=1 Tax=Carnegiea gigantea TaxID=171969 RepID=A0A9Q1K5X3_9CARY|nr:hypothetical protein Cgig2_031941 [Carnegiea gigantea]
MESREKNENDASTAGGGGGGGYEGETMKRARLKSTLSALLDDPILSDVPKMPSLSDVDTLISLELGSAMRISVLKLDDVVLLNTATVKDLKLAIKKKVNEMEQSKMGHRHISWRHVWANYCLLYHNDKLLNESASLQDFGIRNNSQVQFIPFIAAKQSRRHSRRKKHRTNYNWSGIDAGDLPELLTNCVHI